MSIYSQKILFFISATRINKQGLVPLTCRITYKGKRSQFSTGLFINPSYWKSGKQKAHPPNDENNYINTQLSLIKNEISQAFLYLQVNSTDFDVNDIFLKYKGENVKAEKTLLEAFKIHNDRMRSSLELNMHSLAGAGII